MWAIEFIGYIWSFYSYKIIRIKYIIHDSEKQKKNWCSLKIEPKFKTNVLLICKVSDKKDGFVLLRRDNLSS